MGTQPAVDLWAADAPVPDYRDLALLRRVEHRCIHASGPMYRFLLGVSICAHEGVFYAAWGASARDENDAASVFAYTTSSDGVVWGEARPVAPKPPGPDAHSHGVLLATGEQLWALAPRAHFRDVAEFPGLRLEAFVYDRAGRAWQSAGESAPGFWPLCEPRRMEDGNWIMGGAVPHRWPRAEAAVAISDGEDLSRWRVVTIPAGEVTWGETTVLVDGPRVRAFIRPGADGLPLVAAVSRDYGRTWGPQTATNLPVSASKPYAGTLSTGACYLIANLPVPGLGPRDTLAVFVTPPGSEAFSTVRVLRQGKSPAARTAGVGIGPQWAYPYAIEHDRRLYVTYASTKENAELSVVDLTELAG
jgi:hypothetical protein